MELRPHGNPAADPRRPSAPEPYPPGSAALRPSRAAAAALVAAAAWAAWGCFDGSEPAGYETPRGAERVIVGLGVEITSGGRRVLEVEADSGFATTGSGVLTLVGVEARSYGENGLVHVTLEADSGRLDEVGRVFTALGDVRARRRDRTVSLETSELTFDPATGRLRSDSAVTLDQEGRTERLPCFEGDPLLTSWSTCGGGP